VRDYVGGRFAVHFDPDIEYQDVSLSWAELLGEQRYLGSDKYAVLLRQDHVPLKRLQPPGKPPKDYKHRGDMYWDPREGAWFNRKNERRIERHTEEVDNAEEGRTTSTCCKARKVARGDAPVRGRPWKIMLFVTGFRSKHAALAFESAWQKPHKSRHVCRMWHALGQKPCSGRSGVRVRLRALALLLRHGAWTSEALVVRVVCAEFPQVPEYGCVC